MTRVVPVAVLPYSVCLSIAGQRVLVNPKSRHVTNSDLTRRVVLLSADSGDVFFDGNALTI
jgi:hypothetical protein